MLQVSTHNSYHSHAVGGSGAGTPIPELDLGMSDLDLSALPQHTTRPPDYLTWLRRWQYHTINFPHDIQVPLEAADITTPLVPMVWRHLLSHHPHLPLIQFFLQGITEGFRIGFAYGTLHLKSAKSNMHSALEHPEIVNEYIAKEIREGRVAGPFQLQQVPKVQVSRFGVIPKNHQPNKWRLIIDLSHPKLHSVNAGVPKELCSISYVTTDDAINHILLLGKNCLLAKIDIKSAFRLIPVHPADRHLLAMAWGQGILIDKCLPFGLRSAPKLFNLMADLLAWVATDQGVYYLIHYLDDYLTAGQPNSAECQQNLSRLTAICQALGIPLAADKLAGPTTSLEFLGIQLDTSKMEARLPDKKMARLKQLITEWQRKKHAKKREILSLIGQLQHAAKVVRPGRTFVRRMYSTACSVQELDYFVRLNHEFRSDLHWWHTFLQFWNGVSFFQNVSSNTFDGVIQTDASGNWGCGGAYSNLWFQWSWGLDWTPKHIMVKELVPIVISVAIWGTQLSRKRILIQCDNMGVVAAVTKRSSKEPLAMHLLRCLWFFTAHFDISLTIEHIPGVLNEAADHLSRNNLIAFRIVSPQARLLPTLVPQELVELVINNTPDWTSPRFKQLFNTILTKV